MQSTPVGLSDPRYGVDGQTFKRLIGAALQWLRHHQEAVNALNVFPVPDGDTGTNMVLTMQSAWNEIAQSPQSNVGQLAGQLAHGALMGARGNSGVILSQIWRGLARSLDSKPVMHAADLALALQEASDTAYKGVVKPVEGTILTVIREVAAAAGEASKFDDDLIHLLSVVVDRSRSAVARTPTLLAVLREAGVVDAGGQGLHIILEGMLRCMRGEVIAIDTRLEEAVDLARSEPHLDEFGPRYDVQFILMGNDMDVVEIRDRISAMGESALIVGDPATIKVHVHVDDPGQPISYGVQFGALRDVVVEDMQAQYQEYIMGRQSPPVVAPQTNPDEIATVAVVPAAGLTAVFQSLGVAAVVPGGQTMNPSTEQLLRAVEELPNREVILLPNNSNVLLAAEQARTLCESKRLAVVPTRSIPQGIAALLAFNFQADLETNCEMMKEAAQAVGTGEITTATRSVELDGVKVTAGQIIGLYNDRLVVAAASVEEALMELLERMQAAESEIITLYYGNGLSAEEVEPICHRVEGLYPDQEFECIEGGQPHYHFVISVE